MKRFTKTLGRKKYLAAAIPLIMAANVQSIEFYTGGIEGSFASSFSMGSSWRTQDADAKLLGATNGNDGNANYAKGDAFSQIFKGSHDFQVSYQNFGAFVRGKYWYDSALENNQVNQGHGPTMNVSPLQFPAGHPMESLNGATNYNENASKLDDSGFNDLAKFSGAAILDAFIYGEFEVADMPLDVRLGKQVVSWGESTFIMGGINAINPVDVSAFRRPGAEIKEGLIPVNMAYANIGVTDNLSVEAFYQLEFQETVLPGCGTFFSTNDYAPEGCDVAILSADAGLALLRNDDGIRRPKNDGQFGIAARYLLGDTELGFYAMNIHSRMPVASGVVGGPGVNGGSTYFIEYPEDLQIAGLSFATNLASMALSGEISHKKDTPFQLNSNDFFGAALSYGQNPESNGGAPAKLNADVYAISTQVMLDGGNPVGNYMQGWRPHDVTQAQVTAMKFFDQVAGAGRVILIGEAGVSYVHGFDEDGEGAIKFGQSGIYEGSDDGFITETSYGYRARVVAQYSDVFAGINLTPVLSWKHDVEGWGPRHGGGFKQGEKALGLTLKANFLSTYNAAVSYTQYMDGDATKTEDRDFASITVGVQF